jgi:CheY-like chemotaxis protein
MRILVVDDNADVLESMVLLLQSAGYETQTTNDGRKALALNEQPADLLITDLFMPEADGFELIAKFRQRWPKMKILVMSGGGTIVRGNYLALAIRFGADATMSKPFEPSELFKKLAHLTATARHEVPPQDR